MRIHKLIIIGWIVYITAFFIPWSGKPFGGWLLGWFWLVIDVGPVTNFLSTLQLGIKEIASIAAILAGFMMLGSPLFLYLIKKDFYGWNQYVPLAAFILAIIAFILKIIIFVNMQSGMSALYITGNAVWLTAFGLVYAGFKQQLHYIKTHVLQA